MTQVTFAAGENNPSIHAKLNMAVQGFRFIRRTVFTGLNSPVIHRCDTRAKGLHGLLIGPGGGGAGAPGGTGTDAAAGSGGGAAGYTEFFNVDQFLSTLPLTILAPPGGSGGIAGATPGVSPSSGAAIIVSDAGIFIAHQGIGGLSMAPGTSRQFVMGGNGGFGLGGGEIPMPGEAGGVGFRFGANLAVSGSGGNSFFMGGGQQVIAPGPGQPARSYGSGGSGGASSGVTSMPGGRGGDSLVLLDEYY